MFRVIRRRWLGISLPYWRTDTTSRKHTYSISFLGRFTSNRCCCWRADRFHVAPIPPGRRVGGRGPWRRQHTHQDPARPSAEAKRLREVKRAGSQTVVPFPFQRETSKLFCAGVEATTLHRARSLSGIGKHTLQGSPGEAWSSAGLRGAEARAAARAGLPHPECPLPWARARIFLFSLTSFGTLCPSGTV